jgi:hypothetical protein
MPVSVTFFIPSCLFHPDLVLFYPLPFILLYSYVLSFPLASLLSFLRSIISSYSSYHSFSSLSFVLTLSSLLFPLSEDTLVFLSFVVPRSDLSALIRVLAPSPEYEVDTRVILWSTCSSHTR